MPTGRSPFQPRVECLEDRNLMTAHITASLEGGLLRIVGTPKSDHIVVQQKNNMISVEGIDIRVRGRSPVASVRAADVSRIQVVGMGGGDTIVLGGSDTHGPNALLKPATVWGGPGNNKIWGDTGANKIYVQNGNDVIWSRGTHDFIDKGHGHAVVHFTRVSARRASTVSSAGNSHKVAPPAHSAVLSRAAVIPFQSQVDRLLGMINSYRASHGLRELTVDARLVAAATYQADYMARTDDYSHFNLDGRDPGARVQAAGYPFRFLAENIHLYDPAIRRTEGIDRIYQPNELAQYFLDGWEVSPPHNENLLSNQVRNMGVAFAEDSAGRIFACADFATT